MLGLVASLGLTLVLVHLPFHTPIPRVGWSGHSSAEQIVLDEVTTERSDETVPKGPEQAPPATDLRTVDPERRPTPVSSEDPDTAPAQQDTGWAARYKDVQSIAELNVSDGTPRIVGGAGSLYLHIDYPERALAQGIEGRLKLGFTVKTDGTVEDVEVLESLHPLCDSAAVKGVRSVRFVPAKHNGTPIPIRLRLPIRFRLTTVSSSAQTNGTPP